MSATDTQAPAVEMTEVVSGTGDSSYVHSKPSPAEIPPISAGDGSRITSVTLSFENLRYIVKKPTPKAGLTGIKAKLPCTNTEKVDVEILKDISGVFQPRSVTAIMGPSGAGKTTLLNVLAGRAGGKVLGKILVNGHEIESQRTWKKIAAYVIQDDIMFGTLTPRESFMFAAQMRLPKEMSFEEKKQRVEDLLEELGLTKCADTRIGIPGLVRGISGGERKRVSIGLELITDPSIVFIDEPTSGLDSSTAYNLMLTLRRLADKGRTIITTIHQPSSEMFQQFDQLMLIAKGEIMYFGAAANSVEYFATHGFQCPRYTNPADYFMGLCTPKKKDRSLTLSGSNNTTNSTLGTSSESTPAHGTDVETGGTKGVEPVEELLSVYRELHKGVKLVEPAASDWPVPQSAALFTQLRLLMQRSFVNLARDKLAVRSRFFQTIILALLVGLIFLQVDDDQEGVQDRSGALFFVTINQSMLPMLNVLMLFPKERVVFLREYASGSYSSLSYFISKTLTELPFQVVLPFLFAVIVYWMVGFQDTAAKFFIFTAALVLGANTSQSIGLLISSAIPNPEVSMAIAPLLFIPLMLFGGLFLNDDSTPVYFIWLKYLSFFRYTYEILVVNEFRGLDFSCSKDEEVAPGVCRINDGDEEIDILSMDDVSIGMNFLALAMLYLGTRVLAYFCFRQNSRIKQ